MVTNNPLGFLCHFCNVSSSKHTALLCSLIHETHDHRSGYVVAWGVSVSYMVQRIAGADHSSCHAH